jgi:lipopolysaccharide transport system permease protein
MESLRHNLDLLYELTKKELKVRYKSSVLGYLWSLLNPLAMTLVFYLAFRIVLKVRLTRSPWPFALFLIAGLFPWQWLANSLSKCTDVYVANAALVRRVAFRRALLPLAAVLNDLIHFLISLPVIVGFLLYAGGAPSWHWLYGLPAFLAAQLLLVYGLSLILAAVNVLFRDLTHLIQILLQMLFYLTPILYDMDAVAARGGTILALMKCNPAAGLMEGYRQLFLNGRFLPEMWALAAAHGLAAMTLGLIVHARLKWRLAEVI